MIHGQWESMWNIDTCTPALVGWCLIRRRR